MLFAVVLSIIALGETCSISNAPVGTLVFTGDDVAVSGSYAYLASSTSNSLTILDISDPTNPNHVGALVDVTDLVGTTAVKVVGNYVYMVAHGSNSFVIVDVSNPGSPSKVGSINTSPTGTLYGAENLHVDGNYAYVVAKQDNSLTIIDISNKASPAQVGYVQDGLKLQTPAAVLVITNFAYVATDTGYFTVVDCTDKTSPTISTEVSNINLLNPVAMDMHSGYVWILGSYLKRLLSVSLGGVPTVAQALTDSAWSEGPYDLVIDYPTAYVAANGKVAAVDISDYSSPTVLASIANAQLTDLRGIAVDSNYLYTVSRTTGFTVLNKCTFTTLTTTSVSTLTSSVSTSSSSTSSSTTSSSTTSFSSTSSSSTYSNTSTSSSTLTTSVTATSTSFTTSSSSETTSTGTSSSATSTTTAAGTTVPTTGSTESPSSPSGSPTEMGNESSVENGTEEFDEFSDATTLALVTCSWS